MIAGDVTPVLDDFAPVTRPKLTPQTVGRIQKKLAPLGDFQKIVEDTPGNAPHGLHIFRVSFAHAIWHEDFSLDGSGKIVGWHVFALPPHS